MRLRAYNPISRARWALLTLLFVVTQFGPLAMLSGTAGAASTTTPAANPALSKACGLDIAIVIDNSTSISSSEMSSFKTALKSFTNALSGTPTQFSVTKFATNATVLQNFTSDTTTVNTAIDSVTTGGGYTNWEDGLIKANSTFASGTSNPNLVIFATDGDPTTSNTVGGVDTNQPNAHLEPAIVAANTVKNGGTRMLALGIGITGSSLDRLKAISGPNANTGNVLTSDVITTDFSTLASDLATFASQTCGGTITTTKYIDADGNANTTNDQTLAGAGWEFDINGGSNPAATQTDASGKTPAVKVDAASGYSVNETQKAGYTLLSASCTGAAANGSKNGNAVTGVQVAANNIVSCKFVNTATKGTLTVNKVVSNTHGGTKKASDFSFTVNGQTYAFNSNGTNSITLPTGTYTVDEVNPNTGGYAMTGNTCTNVVVSYNQTTTCTITNSDVSPKLIVKKHVVNDNGGSKVASNFTMKVTGTNVSSGSFAGDENGTTITLNPGTYTVDETADSAYAKTLGADCSGTIALGETKTCTVTNDDKAAGLTLVKNLIKDNGGTANATDWTLKAVGASASPTNLSGTTGSAGATSGANFKADTYTLSETGGPSGYTSQGWSCTGGVTVSQNNTITLTNGQTTTCTVTNNDDAAGLTLVKNLVDQYNSGLAKTAWTLTATGPSVVSGAGGATSSNVSAGTYTLGESGPTAGFTASAWSCTGGTLQANQLIVALGQNVTCTITNTSQPATLIVKKVVKNDNGGSAVASDFSFSNNGGASQFFNGNGQNQLTLAKGTYTVTEDQANKNGYVTSYDGCTSVVISNGETKTCTITNDDKAPKLTLVKEVVNNNGGTAKSTDWTLTATGPTSISGAGGATSGVSFKAGTYTLSESTGPAGYTLTGWNCVGAKVSNNQVALTNGQEATCTATNDDNSAALTLVKKLGENLYGATVSPTAWTLTADGPSYLSGTTPVSGNVDAGNYTLSENGPKGFTASNWTCVNNVTKESFETSSALALVLGADYTCTITNTAVQPKLTVIKHVVNGKTGGSAQASDFTMYVDGNSVSNSQFSGNEAGTSVTLNVGEYEVSEGSHDGYTASYSEDCEGTVSLGDAKTCTVTNTAIAPTLTLKKKVINNNNGDSSASDWTLTATPAENSVWATEISGNGQDGVEDVPAKANVTYTLSESGPSGYTAGNWYCNNGSLYGDQLTMALGQNVTCTITNNDNQNPNLEVFKYGPATAHEGDTVLYSFWVHNSGDTYIDNLSVVDDIAGNADCNVWSLSPGDWAYCTVEYTIPTPQVADVVNTVKACGDYYGDSWNWDTERSYVNIDDEEGTQICATDNHTLDVLHPAIKVVKTGPATAKVGDTVTYTFTVTNVGDEPLDGITVADNIAGNGAYKSGDTNNDGKLDVNETWVYTATYTIPAGSEGKQIVNTVKACGSEQQAEEVNPGVSILKVNSESIQLPKNETTTVCATDSHTTTVEKPQVLVDTGSGSLTALGYILVITMLGGAFAVSRRR